MSQPSKFAVYFSHSWRDAHLPINLKLWEKVSEAGHLLVDRPDPIPRTDKPYFISRIETRMRRADLFVCCMPAVEQWKGLDPLPARTGSLPVLRGDWNQAHCSAFILFELRIAQRLDIPRFVLYDVESGFVPPRHQPLHVAYFPCQFGELRELLNSGISVPDLDQAFDRWYT